MNVWHASLPRISWSISNWPRGWLVVARSVVPDVECKTVSRSKHWQLNCQLYIFHVICIIVLWDVAFQDATYLLLQCTSVCNDDLMLVPTVVVFAILFLSTCLQAGGWCSWWIPSRRNEAYNSCTEAAGLCSYQESINIAISDPYPIMWRLLDL